ncbi:MAG: hypothetical protein M1830_002074 [Pleopsidium flavum]|nr:MAG: hypothetical protein M1830_002074 [Pleopsidium flavum]
MIDKAAVSKLGEMDPELAAFLTGIKDSPPPPDRPDLAGCRKLFAEREKAMLEALGSSGDDLTEIYQHIPMRDGYESRVKIIKPTHAPESAPSAGFVVGGVSAGGNLAAVLAQLAQDKNLEPSLTGQWLAIPVLLDEAIVSEKYKDVYFSQEQNVNALELNRKSLDEMAAYSRPDVHSPLYSPLNSAGPAAGLPPAYIQVCGLDVVRDDALIYKKVLKEQGVKTRLDLKSSRKAAVDIAKGMGWLLRKEVDEAVAEKEMGLPPTA